MTVETSEAEPLLPDGWPTNASITMTLPLRLIRHVLPRTHLVCEWTLRAIEARPADADHRSNRQGPGVPAAAVPAALPRPPRTRDQKFAPPRIGGRIDIAACIEVIGGQDLPVYHRAPCRWRARRPISGRPLPLRLAVQGGADADAWYLIANAPGVRRGRVTWRGRTTRPVPGVGDADFHDRYGPLTVPRYRPYGFRSTNPRAVASLL